MALSDDEKSALGKLGTTDIEIAENEVIGNSFDQEILNRCSKKELTLSNGSNLLRMFQKGSSVWCEAFLQITEWKRRPSIWNPKFS